MPQFPTVADLAAHLAGAVEAERYARDNDPAGVWIDSDRPVRRLGLRLEAGPPPYGWADGLDAVLVHRPFGLWPARLPSGVGALAYHHALDDHLSVGYNPVLAEALGAEPKAEPLERDGKRIGLVGSLPAPLPYANILVRLAGELGGVEQTAGPEPDGPVTTVALVGAMTEALVASAHERGVQVYVTGQIRQSGVAAAERLGVRVVAVGQGRGERWGLRHLARLVQERWPEVAVIDLTA